MPFQNSKIYTDTLAINYIYDHLRNADYKKYFDRIRKLLSVLCSHASNDTLLLEDVVPFLDTVADLYPKNWYLDETALELIYSRRVMITDLCGNKIEEVRIKNPGKNSVYNLTTLYLNAATKEELFRHTIIVPPPGAEE